VDVDDRNHGTKETIRAPIAEPKRGVARAYTPHISGFENVFGSNYRRPRGGAAVHDGIKGIRTGGILLRKEIHP